MSGKLDELIGSSRLGRAWRAFRDRLMVSPEFQRFALKFPLTRPIARRYTRELFDICAGFVYTQVLLACVRLDVFGRLSQGPRTLSELSAEMALPESSCRTLLEAAVALSLVDHRGKDVYGLGMLGTAVLANPGVAAMVDHHDLLYADLEDPVAILRQRPDETRLSQYWAYAREPSPAGLPSSGIDRYTTLMATSQAMIAEQVLNAYALDQHRSLLDVGGGNGTFAVAAAQRSPQLRVTVLDLPPVAERARDHFAEAGLESRATAVGGSFLNEEDFPRDADVISLVRIVHDHDDEVVLQLLRNIRQVMPEDGMLLLAEPMAGTPRAEAATTAYFGLYLYAMGQGRPRTADELRLLLDAAGFGRVREVATQTPLLTRVLLAYPGR